MQEGLFGLLKQVGLLFTLVRIIKDESLTSAFKSPKKLTWSYLV